MKRAALIFFVLNLSFLVVFFETQVKVANASLNNVDSTQVIPEESIRLRILANSDSPADQTIKRTIRDRVNFEITNWVLEIDSFQEARQLIKQKLPEIKNIVQQSLHQKGFNETAFSVDFGSVSFPTKLYGDFVYPAGNYEAVLITLGEGLGANWWCVLFPPLCFLDFENGDAVKADVDGKELANTKETTKNNEPGVKFFVVDLFKNLAVKLGSLFA